MAPPPATQGIIAGHIGLVLLVLLDPLEDLDNHKHLLNRKNLELLYHLVSLMGRMILVLLVFHMNLVSL